MYRIFIVEDDEIISEVLKKNLSSWGYDVSCAEDFSNIIQEFVRRDPQLVLLDLKLPFYNGFHWCEEIRRISQVPVIFISSAADNMNMVMAMSRGADDFIAKPFDLQHAAEKMNRWQQQEPGRQEPDPPQNSPHVPLRFPHQKICPEISWRIPQVRFHPAWLR